MYSNSIVFIRLLLLMVLINSSVSAFAEMTAIEYIDKYSDFAVTEMKRSGVPASITLAQGILESRYGNSILAVKANNHFGIKCHTEWTGKKTYMDDDAANECFRHYDSSLDSYRDHSNFLRERSRYQELFALKTTDYKGWSHGLKKAGYATDPNYATRLIKLIEDYQLYKFDSEVDSKDILTNDDFVKKPTAKDIDGFVIDLNSTHEISYNNGVKYIVVNPDVDSFVSISAEFGMQAWEIPTYNDLPANAKIKDYTYLYIQSKRNKAHSSHAIHTVKKGETMHYLSQKYGVKLKRLVDFNGMAGGEEPKIGTVIKLRKTK